MIEKIEAVLTANLPKSVTFQVNEGKNCLGGNTYWAIRIYTAFKNGRTINDVRGQFANHISLNLDDSLQLSFQVFGGMGGQRVYRNIDTTNEKERFYAMVGEKIPFRTPQKIEGKVLESLTKVCQRYIETLQNIKGRGLLRHVNEVDYSFLG
jgi:hypothetical protein